MTYRDASNGLFKIPLYLDTPVDQFEQNINNTVEIIRHVVLGNETLAELLKNFGMGDLIPPVPDEGEDVDLDEIMEMQNGL